MMTLHASGGLAMMEKAVEAAKEESARLNIQPPLILGVTLLTSLDKADMRSVGMTGTVEAQVMRLVKLAEKAGLNGVVASPKEIRAIRENVKDDFLIVTPGIRPAWCQKKDQKRVATPKEADRPTSRFTRCCNSRAISITPSQSCTWSVRSRQASSMLIFSITGVASRRIAITCWE